MSADNLLRALPFVADPEDDRPPSVIVRDAKYSSTLPPPPVSRRRLRVQTLPGLGERADEYRTSLLQVASDEFNDVDELLAESQDGFEL